MKIAFLISKMRNVFGIITYITNIKQEERLLAFISSIRQFHSEEIFILNNESPCDYFKNMLHKYKNVKLLNIKNRRELGAIYQMYDIVKADNYIFLHDTMLMKHKLPDDIFKRDFTPIWSFTPKYMKSIDNGHVFLYESLREYVPYEHSRKMIMWYENGKKYDIHGVFGIMFQCNRRFLKRCEDIGLKSISECVNTRSEAMATERIMSFFAYILGYDVKKLALQSDIHTQYFNCKSGQYKGIEYFIKHFNGR